MQILCRTARRPNQEFLLRQAAKPCGELFSAPPAILNYSVVNYSRQGKLRRLWRLAVATHPTITGFLLNIIRDASVPLRGTIWGGSISRTHSCAASQLAVGFIIQVPLRGTRSSLSICWLFVGAWLCHANIVQRVKSCYKIKIDSRVLDCCFYGVTLCKQHPYLTITPLLHYNSATIRV